MEVQVYDVLPQEESIAFLLQPCSLVCAPPNLPGSCTQHGEGGGGKGTISPVDSFCQSLKCSSGSMVPRPVGSEAYRVSLIGSILYGPSRVNQVIIMERILHMCPTQGWVPLALETTCRVSSDECLSLHQAVLLGQ